MSDLSATTISVSTDRPMLVAITGGDHGLVFFLRDDMENLPEFSSLTHIERLHLITRLRAWADHVERADTEISLGVRTQVSP